MKSLILLLTTLFYGNEMSPLVVSVLFHCLLLGLFFSHFFSLLFSGCVDALWFLVAAVCCYLFCIVASLIQQKKIIVINNVLIILTTAYTKDAKLILFSCWLPHIFCSFLPFHPLPLGELLSHY